MLHFDPQLPVKIVRDDVDECKIDESEMGVLSDPAAGTAQVRLVHTECEVICESRWLCMNSKYCRRLLCRFPSPPLLTIPEHIPVEGFMGAVRFIREGAVDVTPINLGPLLCAASQLEISQLQRRLEQYLRVLSNIDGSNFLMCWDICYRTPASIQLRDEMMHRAAETFSTLYGYPEWPRLSDHLVRQLLQRQDLKAKSVTSIFEAALTWIVGNPGTDPSSADRIMSAVPFYRMSTIDRLQCLEKAKRMQLTSLVRPRVMLADWHISCFDAGLESASDLRPDKYEIIFGEKRLNQQWYREEQTGKSSQVSTVETSMSTLVVSEAVGTEEQKPKLPASGTENEPSRFAVNSIQKLRNAQESVSSDVAVPAASKNFGKPIRFFSRTWIKKLQSVPESPAPKVAPAGPIVSFGKPIRFTSKTWITKVRDTSRENVPNLTPDSRRSARSYSASTVPSTAVVSTSDKEAPNAYGANFGKPISFRSITWIKKGQNAQESPAVKVASVGPIVDFGKPIRFSSQTWTKRARGDGSRETIPNLESVRETVSCGDISESKAFAPGFGKPIGFTSTTRIKKYAPELSEVTLPSTASSEVVFVSETVSPGSKTGLEQKEAPKIDMGKPVRFSATTMVKKLREDKQEVVYEDVVQLGRGDQAGTLPTEM